MTGIDINEILKFTPAQEEFSKYIFNGRLGKCMFYIDDLATEKDLIIHESTSCEIVLDRGMPMGMMNKAMIGLANPMEPDYVNLPFIFITSSVFALRMFQQSLITVVSKKGGKAEFSQPSGRIFMSNINDTIDWLYPGNVLNNWCEPLNRLIDKMHVVRNDGHRSKRKNKPEYDHGPNPQITDFDRKLVGQIGDSFLRISLEGYIGLEDHFPRDEEYNEAIHGIELPFSKEQLHEPLSKRKR